ncbi:lipocalin family protein [Brevundimonas sp.]|uniref:lipocalin family protein n=1 Tax=Brevundimonas sp. TaxID=1871086 RepID=UPI00199C2970|nr:lipocalin family protein [Brevundimonas sp.]MBD3835773.1 lipocalin family protein [Brevundimonas sp.]
MTRAALIAAPIAAPIAAVAALLLPAAAQAQAQAVDLDRFDGRWFEIERSHNNVQKDCSRAQIDFTPQNTPGRYGLTVTCTRRADGQVETLRANARITDPETNAKFRFTLTGLLSFGGLAGQNYWVWDHDPAYNWAILALPNKSDWWIWHRNQAAGPAERQRLLARARALGMDMSRVVSTGG